jgi:hypothetical protein
VSYARPFQLTQRALASEKFDPREHGQTVHAIASDAPFLPEISPNPKRPNEGSNRDPLGSDLATSRALRRQYDVGKNGLWHPLQYHVVNV